jgi:hypothetical protein
MNRWLFVGSLVLACAASVSAWFLYVENRSLRARVAALEAAPAASVAAAEPSVETSVPPSSVDAPPPLPSTATVADVPAFGPPPIADVPNEDRGAERRDRGLEAMGRMLSDPEARAATLARMKGNVDRTFGDLFLRLGLDEVQAETLRTLLAERQLAQMEGNFLIRSADEDAARDEARAWRDAKVASLESGVNAILGPDGGNILREYTQSAPQRALVEDVNRRSSFGGAPLDASASERLVQTLRAVQAEHPVDARRELGGGAPITREAVDSVLERQNAQNQAVLAQARAFLTQPQLEALADRQIEDFEALQQQLSFQLRNPDLAIGRGGPRAMRGAGGFPGQGGPPPGG